MTKLMIFSASLVLSLGAAQAADLSTSLALTNQNGGDETPRVRRANNLWGSTGLIFIPTAYTITKQDLSWGMALTKDFTSASVNYGFLQDIELGVAYLDRNGQDNKAFANAKIHIVPKNFSQFKLGIGVMDAFEADEQTFYFVGSADIVTPPAAAEKGAVGFRVHGGVGTGYFSEKLFGGGELFFDNGFSLIGEWDTKNFNAAARYAHDNEFFLELGAFAKRAMFKLSYNMKF